MLDFVILITKLHIHINLRQLVLYICVINHNLKELDALVLYNYFSGLLTYYCLTIKTYGFK